MMKILPINNPEFTDQHWREAHLLLGELRRQYNSFFPDVGWRDLKKQQLSLLEADKDQHRYAVFDDEHAVGWVVIGGRNIGSAEQEVFAFLDALYDNIPREFSRVVAGEAIRVLESYSHPSLDYVSNSKRVSAVARHWQGRQLNILNRYQLDREKADIIKIERWLADIPEHNPTLRLEFHTFIPDRYLKRYAELFSILLNEMPRERDFEKKYHITPEDFRMHNEWREKNKRHLYTYTMHDENDRMIGMTNANVDELDPINVYQAMTGVIDGYRGRGLSKWLKAALFKKIGEDFPDNKYLTTDMRAVNLPIQKVNAQMGYELISEGAEFKVTLESLKKFLES